MTQARGITVNQYVILRDFMSVSVSNPNSESMEFGRSLLKSNVLGIAESTVHTADTDPMVLFIILTFLHNSYMILKANAIL